MFEKLAWCYVPCGSHVCRGPAISPYRYIRHPQAYRSSQLDIERSNFLVQLVHIHVSDRLHLVRAIKS
jgi:hypothetical protein